MELRPKRIISLRLADRCLVALLAIALVLMTAVAAFLPSACATRPAINSAWANKPPSMNGKFLPEEWPASPQIVFSVPPYNSSYLDAKVYVTNDNSKLYVMVDATGDRTDDSGDENLLVFWATGTPEWTWVEYWGEGGAGCTSPNWNCVIPRGDVLGVVGYGTSPNSPTQHKMYETSIALTLLNATAGQQISFCSPLKPIGSSISYDDATGRDNPWPDGLIFYVELGHTYTDINTWGLLNLAANPVPEFAAPTTLLSILSMTLLASIILIYHNRRKHVA